MHVRCVLQLRHGAAEIWSGGVSPKEVAAQRRSDSQLRPARVPVRSGLGSRGRWPENFEHDLPSVNKHIAFFTHDEWATEAEKARVRLIRQLARLTAFELDNGRPPGEMRATVMNSFRVQMIDDGWTV